MYKVLKDFKGSPNGYDVVDYVKGQEVDLTTSLAETALAEKWVKPIPAKSAEETAAEQRAALIDEIAALETRLAAAADDAKPEIEAALIAQQEALAALG